MDELEKWKNCGQPIPPPDIVKQYIVKNFGQKYQMSIFIETGTLKGEMIQSVLDQFTEIYSIEYDFNLYSEAKKRFDSINYVHIIQGNSGEKLSSILKNITVPCLFWLDAHNGNQDTPILQELSAIMRHPIKSHVILIDDMRDFRGFSLRDKIYRMFGKITGYPSQKDVENFVLSRNSNLICEINADIMMIYPRE
jgi:hypothetical protein